MPQINFTQGLIKYTDIKPIFAGISQCKSAHAYGPAVRRYCIIHFCIRGKGVFQNSGGTYEVNAGQAFIINPDEVTFYKADDLDPWMYTWIAFSGAICERIATLEPVITVQDKSVFSDIRRLLASGVYTPEQYLICLIRLFENILPASPDNLPGYAARAKEYIKLHYMENISIEQLAASLNIDRRYLLRLFKKEYGITIVNYLVTTRLDAAYGFLRDGFPVNKAAVMCGYSDAYNFSKMFKKYRGISPSAVRCNSKKTATPQDSDEYICCQ